MDVLKILAELKSEAAQIEEALASLEKLQQRRGRMPLSWLKPSSGRSDETIQVHLFHPLLLPRLPAMYRTAGCGLLGMWRKFFEFSTDDQREIDQPGISQQRIHRSIERNVAELRALRAERKAACEQTLEEAQLLAQLAQSKGEKYDAAADFPPELLGTGSVFSDAAITRLIARNQRLNRISGLGAFLRRRGPGGRQMPAAA
jgi:hypothetical protein